MSRGEFGDQTKKRKIQRSQIRRLFLEKLQKFAASPEKLQKNSPEKMLHQKNASPEKLQKNSPEKMLHQKKCFTRKIAEICCFTD